MTRSELTDSIRSIIAEQFGVDPTEVTPETRMAEDLGSDSLDCVELTMSLEDEFEIFIEDDKADAAKTFAQIIDLVASEIEVVAE